MNCGEGSILGQLVIDWERFRLMSGLLGEVAMWGLWVVGAASVLFLVLFPIACVTSWTIILGTRLGWWQLPEAQESKE